MNFDTIVENKLKEAFENGQFDNLPGKGKPLNLNDNPHEPAAWRLAYKMLHDQGFTLPWIAERKELEEAIEKAVQTLRKEYAETHRSRQPDVWARAEWQKAQDTFHEVGTKLNRRIRDYNLSAPHITVQRSLLDIEAEINRVERQSLTAEMWKAADA